MVPRFPSGGRGFSFSGMAGASSTQVSWTPSAPAGFCSSRAPALRAACSALAASPFPTERLLGRPARRAEKILRVGSHHGRVFPRRSGRCQGPGARSRLAPARAVPRTREPGRPSLLGERLARAQDRGPTREPGHRHRPPRPRGAQGALLAHALSLPRARSASASRAGAAQMKFSSCGASNCWLKIF